MRRVAVITGASSGIGRVTAVAFAEAGYDVVLTARRAPALEEVAARCEEAGARALALPGDVNESETLPYVARTALDSLGRLDVWVNNAGVVAYGNFEDLPFEQHARVVETNLLGYMRGAHAAMRILVAQKQGILINNASLLGAISAPYMSSYVATKYAIRGLSSSLRQELLVRGLKDVHVCTVLPATIDTQIFLAAANRTGHRIVAMPPVYPPETVARAILSCARKPRREAYAGKAGLAFAAQWKILPAITERIGARFVDAMHLDRKAAAVSDGNLFAPNGSAAETGEWHGRRKLAVRRAASGAAVLGAAAWMLRHPRNAA